MPEEFSKFIDNKSPSHSYLHTNISSLSYHIDDLVYFILICKKRPRITRIFECKAYQTFFFKKNTYEFTSMESSK